MPVVELSYSRLEKLIGKVSRKQILESLPYLGLDIESESKDEIRIEYSPNRPDYSTDFGIALGMQGLLGTKKGLYKLKISSGSNKILVDSSVSKIRPYVTSIIAKGGSIDDATIKQLMVMQEDLHFGIGRRRKKSSIGIHDLDTISFPLKYSTTDKNHKFTPLNSNQEQTITDILKNTDVGRDYGSILGNSTKFPIIIDSKGKTVSFPPIINASMTTVTTKTKNLLVEVTGLNKDDVEDALSVVATILQSAGFKLESVKISGSKNSSPLLKNKKLTLDSDLVNKTLGTNLTTSLICSCLKKSRLDAIAKGKKIECTIPRYRFDIFGPMDLVEEVALGYGIQNLEPILSPSLTVGQKNQFSEKLKTLSSVLVGLGFTEALNSSLTSERILYSSTQRDPKDSISVVDSKSQEHTILRDSLLPGLIENLSRNIHEQYPQKLFEIGTVFTLGNPINETTHVACVSAHQSSNFTEIKSIMQSMLKTSFNLDSLTKTSSESLFKKGRSAKVILNGNSIGTIGEIDSAIIENFKIRVPVVGFEINLPG
ncbi:MAG: phenylalanine--tRNA ligase subunit beta [Crenarchaeota archaeon]|nr:MAG: phenylalanine--tRNA ligase subunit beta [Thermoproteota archaeon]RDJ33108.1 MAG: phenylalanine--tRNA ligase subunit beta [Thermoproteota archaeon]RDJ36388.1 MAG: phenylalanine--tRNA ligase subunit beta [Thermoproteota archaeon]RDJ39018.1 MAG: phenylalanine--tRNA ligase subunit beta [Thermoproteota archaeon]